MIAEQYNVINFDFANFDHISDIVLMFISLTLSMYWLAGFWNIL